MNEKAIRTSARGENCTIRLPSVCNFDSSTTVFAHISGIRFGHGVGKKTAWGAYACSACHDIVDGRTPRPYWLTEQDVKIAHYEGCFETQDKLREKGLL